MGAWQGVTNGQLTMDYLKFPPCATSLRPASGPPQNPETAIFGVARLQGGRPVAVLYHFGHPTPYASGRRCSLINMETTVPPFPPLVMGFATLMSDAPSQSFRFGVVGYWPPRGIIPNLRYITLRFIT